MWEVTARGIGASSPTWYTWISGTLEIFSTTKAALTLWNTVSKTSGAWCLKDHHMSRFICSNFNTWFLLSTHDRKDFPVANEMSVFESICGTILAIGLSQLRHLLKTSPTAKNQDTAYLGRHTVISPQCFYDEVSFCGCTKTARVFCKSKIWNS